MPLAVVGWIKLITMNKVTYQTFHDIISEHLAIRNIKVFNTIISISDMHLQLYVLMMYAKINEVIDPKANLIKDIWKLESPACGAIDYHHKFALYLKEYYDNYQKLKPLST